MSENKKDKIMIPDEVIMSKILVIRGERVMIDSDLAELFGVTTKRLNQQVKRNIKRFPPHFMFQLTKKEKEQVVAKCDHLEKIKYSPHLPFAFTEHGTIMLANTLNNDQAILEGIRVVEIFIKMREILLTYKEVLQKLEEIEKKLGTHDDKILLLFEYLKQFEQSKQQELEQQNRKKIGFKTPDKE